MRSGLVAVVLLFSISARGDTLQATLEGPLFEVSHEVEVTVAGGVAIYRVRRVFANPGKQADEATVEITLPYAAAATGLRIRARDRWYDADFLPAEEAQRRYLALTGMGKYQPKDPALLAWIWPGELLLRVFPVFPGGASTVEYTLVAPTRYDRGRYFVSYPRAGEGKLAPPILRVKPAWGDAVLPLFVDGQRVPPDAPVVLAAPETGDRPDFVPGNAGWVESTLEVPAEADGTLAKVELSLAVEHTYRSDLSIHLQTPAGAAIEVVVKDGGGANDVREKRTLVLPAGTKAAGRWRLHVVDSVARDSGTLVAWSLRGQPAGRKPFLAEAADLPRFVPDAQEDGEGGVALVEIAPPPIDTVASRLGRVPAGRAPDFLRLELDVAPQLRPLPRAPEVVFVVDVSRSLEEEQIAAQLAVARAYLSHVPDARAEVVLFDRRARRLFGRWVSPADWDAQLARAAREGRLRRGNGSAFDDGLALAQSLFGPKTTERRIVATTDALFRQELTVDRVPRSPAGVLLHVVVPHRGDGETQLERDDAHAFASVPAATGGIWAELDDIPGGPECLTKACPDEQKRLAVPVLGLVRPVRLDRVVVTGAKFEIPEQLGEGTGVRLFARGAPSSPVVLEARIWNQPYRKELAVDPGFSRQAAGFVFGEDEHGGLSDGDQMVVAQFGRVVSPVTSFLAVEPGTRPSLIGLRRDLVGGVGGGSGYGSIGGGSYGSSLPSLADLLRPIAERCRASVRLIVETTLDEIVDVVPVGAPNACVIEGVWGAELPGAYRRIQRRREEISL